MTTSDVLRRIEATFDHLQDAIEYIGVTLFLVVNSLAALQIFVRFFGSELGLSAIWTEEVARYFLVVMVFVGAPYATRMNENISIRPLFRLVPVVVQKVLLTFSNAMIIIFSMLVIYSVYSVLERTLSVTLSTIRWLSVGYVQVVLGAMFVLVILFAIEETVIMWRTDESPIEDGLKEEEIEQEGEGRTPDLTEGE